MASKHTILLVEDSRDDVFFMKRALKAAGIRNPLHIVDNGQQAVDYLSGTGVYADRVAHPLPAVVFLDLKLPLKSGHDVLAWIRRQPAFDPIFVIVLTSSNESSDFQKCQRLGASCYLVKPATPEQLTILVETFKWDWIDQSPETEGDSTPEMVQS